MSDPQQGHPRIISESVEVDAQPAVVFAILADPGQHSRIDGSGSVQQLIKGPERLSKGARFGMDMKLFGMPYKIRNTVVEFEEDRRIAWRHFGGHRWRYVLEPTGGGTTVTESFDYSQHPLSRPPGDRAGRLPRAQPPGHRRHAGQAQGGGRVGRGEGVAGRLSQAHGEPRVDAQPPIGVTAAGVDLGGLHVEAVQVEAAVAGEFLDAELTGGGSDLEEGPGDLHG